ncbi:MAG: ribonuclease H-like domain-containing protein [Candidatus Shapirobacteria bacterium]|nr:ribonuclease H-like domain-containing protein [Candidatus Shapirobacteria bacterium]MDD4410673.1 ribonuclease H-like domain-containing protein [Candidatus Shapirobacteria bacterium]
MAIKFEANELIRDKHFLVKSKEIRKTVKGDEYYILQLCNPDGTIEAKIWNNNIPQCNFEEGKVIEVNGKSQEYNGKTGIIIDSCQIVTTEEASDYSPSVPTLVFDIETLGKNFEELDEVEQDYLLNNLEKNEPDKEIAKNKTALYSIFGIVCAIGAVDVTNKTGFVLSLSTREIKPEKANFTYKTFTTEKELLEEFWKMTPKYEQFVTYNGDTFDFPYLMIRSGINRVKMPFEIKKWGSDKFLDLQTRIRQSHAFKLEMLCKAFGIENPKEKGVHGDDVTRLYNEGEFNKIADYVARDAVATTELYLIWKNYMSGQI